MQKYQEHHWNEEERAAFAAWRNVRLSAGEKRDLREAIRSRIALPETSEERSFGMFPMPLFFRHQTLALASVAGVIFIFGGFGVARASQASLPGEWLYTIKVGVTEPAERLLFTDSEEERLWENILAERRIEEADALAEKGRLGEKEQQKIEALLDEYAAEIKRDDDGGHDEEIFTSSEASQNATHVEVRREEKDGMVRYRIRERNEDKGDDRVEIEIRDETEDEEEKKNDDSEDNRQSDSQKEDDHKDDVVRSSGSVKSEVRTEKSDKKEEKKTISTVTSGLKSILSGSRSSESKSSLDSLNSGSSDSGSSGSGDDKDDSGSSDDSSGSDSKSGGDDDKDDSEEESDN